MTTYVYSCQKCQIEMDIVQKMSDNSLTKCPVCQNEESFKKIIQPGNFVLKGTGWYETDFKGK